MSKSLKFYIEYGEYYKHIKAYMKDPFQFKKKMTKISAFEMSLTINNI